MIYPFSTSEKRYNSFTQFFFKLGLSHFIFLDYLIAIFLDSFMQIISQSQEMPRINESLKRVIHNYIFTENQQNIKKLKLMWL